MRLRYGSRRSSLKNTRTFQNDTKISSEGRRKKALIKKAKEILDRYIELRHKGTYVEFENYKYDIFEKYEIDDADWDKVVMWDKNPRNTLLKQITYQLKEKK